MSKLPRLLPLIAIAIGGVVAVRAVGVAPDLFTGATAWAEEAISPDKKDEAAQAKAAAPAVCALTPEQLAQQAGISPAELRIIQSLSKRRGELDARDKDFDTTLPLMMAAEQKIDAKLNALNALKAEIQGLVGQVDEKQKAEQDRLVAVYSAMRPKEAAAVFNTLSDDVRLPVAATMRPRTLAAIMAQMPPAKAQELTEKLAKRFQAQELAARAAAASTPPITPAAQPASEAEKKPEATRAAQPPARAQAQPARNTARTAPRPAQRPAAKPAATPAASSPSAPAVAEAPTPRQTVE